MTQNTATLLAVVGVVIMGIGSLWILGLAFKKSIVWGLLSLFVPLVIWIFIILNIRDTVKPLLALILGGILFGLGYSSMPHPAP